MASLQPLDTGIANHDPIVIVSGLPRSGTSMAMQMLEAGGMTPVQDSIRAADEDNPKGYYEDERVKSLHKDLDKSWLTEAQGKFIKIVSFFLFYLPSDYTYKILFMCRDIDEVLASQEKMLFRRQQISQSSNEKMANTFKDHLDKVHDFIQQQTYMQSIDVNYSDILNNPYQQAELIQNFLTLPLDINKMASIVDQGLYRNRR